MVGKKNNTGKWDPDEPKRRAVIEKSQMVPSFS